MKAKKLVFYLLSVLLGGCIPSLHPLYTDKELVFEHRLLGTWSQNDQRWEFKEGQKEKSYDLTFDDKGEKGKFTARLVKIDKMLFLDLFPKEPEIEANDFYKFHLLPVHTFLKIEQIDPVLKMRAMNPDKFKEMIEDKPELIRHEVIEDRIVLTASTKQLQQFMRKHANDEDLFGDASDLARAKTQDSK